MRRAYIDIPEGQIHYRTAGSGRPILLLHESPTSSITYSRVIPLLAERFRVIAMDTMGYGNSDLPPTQYEIEDYGRSIKHFLDALQIEKTSIVGHHTGSALAVEVATRYPERIDKVVLTGLKVPTDPQKAEELRGSQRYRFEGMDEEGQFVLNRWRTYRALCTTSKLEDWYPLFVATLLPGSHAFDGHQAIFRHDILPRLPLLTQPTLIVTGTKDVVVGDEAKLLSLIPNVTTKTIEGGGVFVAMEMPHEYASAILEFV